MSLRLISILLLPILINACSGPNKTNQPPGNINQADNKPLNDESLTSEESQLLNSHRKAIVYGEGDVVSRGFLDSSGNMWFTTSREGVFKYDGISFTNLTVEDGLCSNEVSAIIEDKEGLLWFGTASGLCSYDGNTFHQIPIPRDDATSDWLERGYPIINPSSVISLIQDRNGLLWIGSNGGGAYSYDGQTFTSYLKQAGRLQPDSLYHHVITSILEDRLGNIWFSSFCHGGLNKYDGTAFTHYGIEDGLGDDMVSTSYIDRSGNLWFGTRSGGMSKFDGQTFSNLIESEGICQNNMASVYEDEEGKLWVGSFARSGVCWYDGESFNPLQIEGSENLVDVKFISEDGEGNIWFGGRYGILWRFDGESLTDFTQKGR